MIVLHSKFVFGVPEKLRPLPEGWRYESKPDDFLRAISPDGREWMVTDRGVILYGTAGEADVKRSGGRLKLGDRFVDDTEQIFWQ